MHKPIITIAITLATACALGACKKEQTKQTPPAAATPVVVAKPAASSTEQTPTSPSTAPTPAAPSTGPTDHSDADADLLCKVIDECRTDDWCESDIKRSRQSLEQL